MGDITELDPRWGDTEKRFPWDDRPPFGAGNTMAVTHGAYSERNIAETAEEIRGELLERFDFLADPMFQTAIERYLRPAARARRLNAWVEAVMDGEIEARPERKGGATTGVDAIPQRVWQALNQAETAAQKFAQDCGLDPIGFARIAKELGWAKQLSGQKVADLASKGRELRRGSA